MGLPVILALLPQILAASRDVAALAKTVTEGFEQIQGAIERGEDLTVEQMKAWQERRQAAVASYHEALESQPTES